MRRDRGKVLGGFGVGAVRRRTIRREVAFAGRHAGQLRETGLLPRTGALRAAAFRQDVTVTGCIPSAIRQDTGYTCRDRLNKMSDNYLRYVPSEPTFRPEQQAAAAATRLLRSYLPEAQNVAATFHESIVFVDAGANWSGVFCPACGADAESWWDDAMSESAETEFTELMVRAGCCGSMVSLNDLRYVWPVAFASFVLEAESPSSPGLSPIELEELASVLGCTVREIHVHV